MSGFLKLIQNENMKIYRRPRTWIIMGIMLVIVIGAGIILKQVSPEVGADEWKQEVEQDLKENQQTLESGDVPQEQAAYLQKQNTELQYSLEKNVNPYEKNNWTFMKTVISGTISLVVLFVVIVASDIVAGEFSLGTIKSLMVQPHPRWRILLSKYIATVIFTMFLLLEVFVFSWLMGVFVYGFGGLDYASYAMNSAGDIVKDIEILQILKVYGLSLMTIFFVLTISFTLSTIFRSGMLAIGIGVLLYFSIQPISSVLSQYTWTKYVIFLNLDMTQYLSMPNGWIEGMSIPFSLSVNAGYWFVFVAIAWFVFQKRDIST